MEPPSKRLKLGEASYDDDDDDEANIDELSMSPTQFDARQDPLYELDRGRAKAATRLKSAFERIFEKYERDFTGIGDEIDLETGEVVINNGHLQSLEDEKVRARKSSISSIDEERGVRKTDVGPIANSKSKSLVQTTSAHLPVRGHPAGPDRIGAINSTHHPLPSFGMPSNPYGSPNPVMFEPPMFGNGPSDPLWQTPEIPTPYHPDMFGFVGQAMGYQPPPGYGYGPMLAPWGGYGTGLLDGLTRPRALTKPSHVKTPKRQSLARVLPIEDDSEEDDLLLGNNTQDVEIAVVGHKSAPPPPATRTDVQANHKDIKQNATAVSENTPQNPRRGPGRPRKDSSPAKAQGLIEETAGKCAESRYATLRVPTPESTNEPITYFAATTISQPPSEEESTLAKQIMAKLARFRTLIPDDTASLYSQSRESSRSRKQIEFSSDILSGSSSENIDTSTATEMANSKVLEVLSEATNPFVEDVISSDSSHGKSEAIQLGPAEETHVEKEIIAESEATTRNQEHHDEPSTNQTDCSGEKSSELDVSMENPSHADHADGDTADLFFTAENSREPEISYPDNSTTKESEAVSEDKEAPSYNKSGSSGDILDKEIFHTPQGSDQDDCSDRGDDQTANFENQTTKDTEVVVDAEVVSHDPVINEIVDTPEAHESNIASDQSQEVAQSPPRIESDETNTQLSGIQQSEEKPTATNTTEPRTLPNDTAIQMTDGYDIQNGAGRHKININGISLPSEPAIGQAEWSLAEEMEVELDSARLEYESSRRQPTNSSRKLMGPSTPKKRREPGPKEPGSRSRLSTPSRRGLALVDLVPDTLEDDEDELSFDLPSSAFRTRPERPRPESNLTKTPRKTGRRHGFLMSSGPGSSSMHTPHNRTAKHPAPAATDSRVLGTGKRKHGFGGGPQSSPLARSVMNRNMDLDNPDLLASTPSRRHAKKARIAEDDGDGVRTPGGTVRRCGVDGFVCDRDFCFTCCR
ncbi:hypothetical protein F4818DRAFT_68908 [Hypoxylon cercidicola]|nr:hypothetical protein F4818DRAFT_68908 [Hypoxylon cercidicola]